MSLHLAGGMLTMRAKIARNVAAADPHGNPGIPVWGITGDTVHCFIWTQSAQPVHDGRKVVAVEQIRACFPREADIKQGDKVTEIKDRRGQTVFDSDLEVDTVTEKSNGSRVAYRQVTLRRARGGP